MGNRHIGFKLAVGFLFVALLATYAFYWFSISKLHGETEGLRLFASHLEASDTFHSAMYQMLLEAGAYYRGQGDEQDLKAYRRNRAQAGTALAELQQYADTLPQGEIGTRIRRRTLELRSAYAEYLKNLDEFMGAAGRTARGVLPPCAISSTSCSPNIICAFMTTMPTGG